MNKPNEQCTMNRIRAEQSETETSQTKLQIMHNKKIIVSQIAKVYVVYLAALYNFFVCTSIFCQFLSIKIACNLICKSETAAAVAFYFATTYVLYI